MSVDGPLRIVLVGAGAIAQAAHIPAILASRAAVLSAIVDSDIDRANTLCAAFGLQIPVLRDIDAIEDGADAAVVATPNHLHAELAKRLLIKGLHVLVEKPLATDLSDASEVVALAQVRGLTLAVGFHTRHSGACRTLKRCIESEQFGKALRFAHQDGSVGGWSPMSAYNLNRQQAGGGVLVTTGTHFLDRLIWIFSYPNDCQLLDDATGGPESHCIARFSLTYAGREVKGNATFSKIMTLPENTVVETEEGLLVMSSDVADNINFIPNEAPGLRYAISMNGSVDDPRSAYQRQLEDFVHACRTGVPPLASGSDGQQVVRLVEQLYGHRQPITATQADPGVKE